MLRQGLLLFALSLVLLHIVEHVLHIIVVLKLLKEFLDLLTLLRSHILIVVRDAFKLRALDSKPFSSRYFWILANASKAP